MDETDAPDIAELLELETEDLVSRMIKAVYFLIDEPETLDQLDIAQRFGRRSCERRRLGQDYFLDRFDLLGQDIADRADNRNRERENQSDAPIYRRGVDRDEQESDDGNEKNIDERCYEELAVGADFLQCA